MKKCILFLVVILASDSSIAGSITNSMLKAFMHNSTARQEILSENIANVSKPGYKSKEVDVPNNFRDLSKISGGSSQMSVRVTNSKHLSGSKPQRRFKVKLDKEATNYKLNGNNVDITEQMKKGSINQLGYDQALKAFQLSNSLISTVVGGEK